MTFCTIPFWMAALNAMIPGSYVSLEIIQELSIEESLFIQCSSSNEGTLSVLVLEWL